jgi:hypothetical protein
MPHICRYFRVKSSTVAVMVLCCWRGLLGDVGPSPATTQTASVLARGVGKFIVRDKAMGQAVAQLRTQAGVPICFERIRLDPVNDRLRDSSGRWSWREVRFSLSLPEGTVGQALDEMVRRDAGYVYAVDQATGMARVYPKTGSILNWVVGPIEVENEPLTRLLFGPEDKLGLLKSGVMYGPKMGFVVRESLQVPVTAQVAQMNVADALNYICSVTRLPGPPGLGIYYRACYDLIPSHRKPYAQLFITGAPEVGEGSPEAALRRGLLGRSSSMPVTPPASNAK